MSKKKLQVQALAFASQLIPAAVGVLSFMLLVRVTQPKVFGEYIIYMAAVTLFEMIKAGSLQSVLVMRASVDDEAQRQRIIGSAYWLGGMVSLAISVVLTILFFSGIFSGNPGVQVFCGWYACLGIVSLPLHMADGLGVAKQDMKFLVFLRLAQSANALITAVYAFFFTGSLESFATVHLLFTTALTIVLLATGKTNPRLIKFKSFDEIRELVKLVKFSMASLATTNLLKTADTFLIGSLMGPASVARYAIALKLTELFDIPLRSLSTTAFPQLAERYNHRDHHGFKYTLIQYLSWSYMLYLPILTGAFIFAPYIVLFIGGDQYAAAVPIFRVLIVYGLFLPANRMTGISLDAMQKPDKNFHKVLSMAIINIIGDLIAIRFTNDLNWVAFVSVLNAVCGVLIGWWMLERTGILTKGNVFSDVYRYSHLLIKQQLTRFK